MSFNLLFVLCGRCSNKLLCA